MIEIWTESVAQKKQSRALFSGDIENRSEISALHLQV